MIDLIIMKVVITLAINHDAKVISAVILTLILINTTILITIVLIISFFYTFWRC